MQSKYLFTDKETKEVYISTTSIENEIIDKIHNYIDENGLEAFKQNMHDIVDKFVDAIVVKWNI